MCSLPTHSDLNVWVAQIVLLVYLENVGRRDNDLRKKSKAWP